MRYCIVVFAMVAAMAASAPLWNELRDYTFELYVVDFGKGYTLGSTEYITRKRIFEQRLSSIVTFNTNPLNLYRQGVNHLTDMTTEEMSKSLFGRKLTGPRLPSEQNFVPTNAAVPSSIDYRQSIPSVLSAVKDQGHCGSCWAFASTASVESHMAIATGKLFSMSPQQLASCVENPNHCGGSGGCDGATADLAFDYLVNASGFTQEWIYPYTSYFGANASCNWNISSMRIAAKLNGFYKLPSNSDPALAEALALHGPIAVSVDATNWHFYESGIFTGCDYSKNISINHAVQLVGYGTENGVNYWTIRNSWSPMFGEHGYIRILRDTACGLNVDNKDGSGCTGDPDTVTTCGMCGVLYDTTFPIVAAPAGPRPTFPVAATDKTYTTTAFAGVAAAGGVAAVGAVSLAFLLFRKKPEYSNPDASVPLKSSY